MSEYVVFTAFNPLFFHFNVNVSSSNRFQFNMRGVDFRSGLV